MSHLNISRILRTLLPESNLALTLQYVLGHERVLSKTWRQAQMQTPNTWVFQSHQRKKKKGQEGKEKTSQGERKWEE